MYIRRRLDYRPRMQQTPTSPSTFAAADPFSPTDEDDRRIEALTAVLDQRSRERLKTPGASLAFLIRVGLLAANGEVARDYRNLFSRRRIVTRKNFIHLRHSKLKQQSTGPHGRHGRRTYA